MSRDALWLALVAAVLAGAWSVALGMTLGWWPVVLP